jgi:aspartyl-tRNA synthetase
MTSGVDPEKYVKENNLTMTSDNDLLEEVISKVLSENAQSVSDYKDGKEKAFGFLVGQAMRELKGKANPQSINAILKERLEKSGIEVSLSAKATNTDAQERTEDSSATDASEISTAFTEESPAGEEILPEETIPAWKRTIMNTETLLSEKLDATGLGNQASIAEKLNRVFTSRRYRTHTCGEISEVHIGKEVKLSGWVHRIRDHGGVMFLDLRDQYGITQVVASDEQMKSLRKEMSVSVTGKVSKRAEDTINPNISTGTVELKIDQLEILGNCKNSLPFDVETSKETKEELRLRYRFLDLRNPDVHDKIVFRAEVIKYLRRSMEELGFLEIQTPILANSSPEGARDYLVPSRKHKGKFYALPQAPQQFKQLLMVSGFDRYFQIAPCFRDEDARLDRSPGEFYQLDFEMAYVTQEDVFAVAEKVMTETFKRFTDKPVTEAPYPRITYEETMLKYGSDKPDLRNPLVIIDLAEFFSGVDFKPFKGSPVRGIVVPGATGQPRSFFSSMEKFALSIGMKGLGYIGVKDDMNYKGPIDKFFSDAQKEEIAKIAELKPGDVLYFISDSKDKVAGLAGQIRTEVARRLDLIDLDRYEFCFVVDYPMYERNEESGLIEFTHNPFSMPQGEMDALLNKDPLEILAYQYDIVCNGVELSSGAVRNHSPEIMIKAFEIAGYSEDDVEMKFGGLYNAFQYGAPPHAGMAPGVDRIVMLLSEDENIREIIAFPLNSNAQNLMLNAPSEVTEQQLREVHIKIR